MLLFSLLTHGKKRRVTEINITRSTNRGINLFNIFKTTQKRDPDKNEKVYFNIASNVTIIGRNPRTPAITDGNGWNDKNELVIVNKGQIIGRGGAGGHSAYMTVGIEFSGGSTLQVINPMPATRGENGGTAISSKHPLLVENYNLIAGGGGGGGGGGAYGLYNTTPEDFIKNFDRNTMGWGTSETAQNGGAAGGGAPYGRSRANSGTLDYLYERRGRSATIKKAVEQIKKFDTAYYMEFGNSTLFFEDEDNPRKTFTVTDTEVLNTPIDRTGVGNLNEIESAKFSKLFPLSTFDNQAVADLKTRYPFIAGNEGRVFVESGIAFPTQTDPKSNPVAWYAPGLKATKANRTKPGKHGFGFGSPSVSKDVYYNYANIDKKTDLSVNHAGDGGNIGEDGKPGVLKGFYRYSDDKIVTFHEYDFKDGLLIGSSEFNKGYIRTAKSGGKAGLIKDGVVTINNIDNGKTKGR